MDIHCAAFILRAGGSFDPSVIYRRVAQYWFAFAVITFLVFFGRRTIDADLWARERVFRAGCVDKSYWGTLAGSVLVVFGLRISRAQSEGLMGSTVNLVDLLKNSFTNPKDAASTIISRGFSYDVIWSVFVASICLTTAMQFFVDSMMKSDGPTLSDVSSPWIFAVMVGGMTLLVCATITWTGQRFDGQANFKTIFALVAWLQVIQLLLQVLIYALLFLVAALAGFAQIAIIFWSLWIFVAFVDTAHKFDNMMKASVVSVLGIGLGGVILFFMISFMGMGL